MRSGILCPQYLIKDPSNAFCVRIKYIINLVSWFLGVYPLKCFLSNIYYFHQAHFFYLLILSCQQNHICSAVHRQGFFKYFLQAFYCTASFWIMQKINLLNLYCNTNTCSAVHHQGFFSFFFLQAFCYSASFWITQKINLYSKYLLLTVTPAKTLQN